jgi:peptidoglycan/LPS O-acetylase OafA/YrhL
MKTLSTTLERDNNNFDLIRLGAALAVMLGHSFGIRGGSNVELMLRFTHRESFGSFAVYGFFLISGLLVSASYEKQSSPLRFTALRALRIWPGAIVCALFIGLVIGPLFTSLSLGSYFSDPQTLHWLVHNTSLIGGVGGPLPGMFEKNHFPLFVNATVWTLPIELECYVIVLVVGLMGVTGSKRGMAIAIAVAGLVFAYVAKHPPAHMTLSYFFKIPIAYSFYPVPFFLLGMLLYAFRDQVRLHWLPSVLVLVIYVPLRDTTVGAVVLYPGFAYGLLWIASMRSLRRFQPKHDYSYGIYLYGFVVQQAVTALLPSLNNYLSVAIAMPIAIALAALSWHLVERPCLAMMRNKSRARFAASAAPMDVSV